MRGEILEPPGADDMIELELVHPQIQVTIMVLIAKCQCNAMYACEGWFYHQPLWLRVRGKSHAIL